MPSFVATAAVTFTFAAASNSTSRTIPTAAAVFLAVTMLDGTGDTLAATIAGAAPTESYQGVAGGGNALYLAVFAGAPSGAQTVAISGGDVGDNWACGFRGVDAIDTADPFDGQVTDDVSPASISVTTSATGLAVGVASSDDATLATSDTEVWEIENVGQICLGVASSPGTGGSVSLDWTGGAAIRLSLAVNLRAAAASGGVPWVELQSKGQYSHPIYRM